MENLTGSMLQRNKHYWQVKNVNTNETLAIASTHQKAYGFITRAENAANTPLPYIVQKVIIFK